MIVYLKFKNLIQGSTKVLSQVGMFAILPMMFLTFADVTGRAIWSRPIPGSLELSSYILAVFVLLGIAYTHQVKGHVRVEMLLCKLPERVQAFLDIITSTLSLFIIGVLAVEGIKAGMEEKAVSDMLRVPQWPFKSLVAVAGILLFMELVFDFIDNVGRLIRGTK
jgi:TRAP-type C4-dicarboxylate transport system permease small subunit